MIRPAFLVVGLCVVLGLVGSADEPKKPQWQRMLSGDAAKKAENLKQRMMERLAKDDIAGAIKAAEEQLELRTKCQGEDHYETVNVKYQIAFFRKISELSVEQQRVFLTAVTGAVEAERLESKGQYAEAVSLRQAYLKWSCEVLGEANPITAGNYLRLAGNLLAQGKYAEAQRPSQNALDIYRKALGEEHPDTARSYVTLALNLQVQGKHDEAQLLHQKALDIHRKVHGEEHPDTALCYMKMAQNLQAQGKCSEAQLPHQKALDIYRKVLGEEHPDTALALNHMAQNLQAQGKYAEAQLLFQQALDIQRKTFGEMHPDTVPSYNNLALNLSRQEKYAEAQLLYQKALDIQRKAIGEEHPDTAKMYTNAAINLQAQGEYAKAQLLYQKALDIQRKAIGEEHPDTAKSYTSAAINLQAQGKYTEAVSLAQKALEICRRVLGEENPDTALCYINVASNLLAAGKDVEAESVLGLAIHSYESSRLAGAAGLDRASLHIPNPRPFLAVLQQGREPNRAWREVEFSLARGLLDKQAARFASTLKADEQAEQTKQRERIALLQPQILFLVTKAKRTEAETATLETLLQQRRDAETRLATLAAKISQRQVAEPDTIRNTIPADAALIFWVDVRLTSGNWQEHWVCAIRSTGAPKWERLPGTGPGGKWSKSDDQLPDQIRIALSGYDTTTHWPVCLHFPLVWTVASTTVRTPPASQAEVDALVKQLHAQRIAPALKHLDAVKTLYVVPVNAMAGVPVELLMPNLNVSYVPSGTFLARAKAQAPLKGQRMLALGDPIFTGPGEKPTPKPLPPGGLLITQVLPGSAAAKAGLQAGDVLLKYGDAELKNFDGLKAAITANAKTTSVSVTVWREDADKPIVRDVASGRMGVVIDNNNPAPVAIANRRKTDALLLSLRGGSWKDLPGTRIETDCLRQMLGDQCVVLNDSDASEQRLNALRKSGELSKFRYLHFATHGEGNSVRAFESALILAQDKLPKDPLPKPNEPFINGQLSAAEVLDFWNLNAELVTLSACETAIGKRGGGDGLLGFAQAFLHAGSRSVCLSLWKVDDTATALLMDRFYKNLLGKREGLKQPMGKAAALDEAKRWLRNLSGEEALALTAKLTKGVARGDRGKGVELKPVNPTDPNTPPAKDSKPFAHPKYWAAFILIGDPN